MRATRSSVVPAEPGSSKIRLSTGAANWVPSRWASARGVKSRDRTPPSIQLTVERRGVVEDRGDFARRAHCHERLALQARRRRIREEGEP